MLIDDFVKSAHITGGYGFFEGDFVAQEYAASMSKNQRRAWRRHRQVPGAFLAMVRDRGLTRPEVQLPADRSPLAIAEYLRAADTGDGRATYMADLISQATLGGGPRGVSQSHVWRSLQLYSRRPQCTRLDLG